MRALLDANIIYAEVLTDLFIHLEQSATDFEFRIHTHAINEWHYSKSKTGITPHDDTRKAMLIHDKVHLITEPIPAVFDGQIYDPADTHVVNAALKGKCDTIISYNTADFNKKSLRAYGIVAIHPDKAIFSLLQSDKTVCANFALFLLKYNQKAASILRNLNLIKSEKYLSAFI